MKATRVCAEMTWQCVSCLTRGLAITIKFHCGLVVYQHWVFLSAFIAVSGSKVPESCTTISGCRHPRVYGRCKHNTLPPVHAVSLCMFSVRWHNTHSLLVLPVEWSVWCQVPTPVLLLRRNCVHHPAAVRQGIVFPFCCKLYCTYYVFLFLSDLTFQVPYNFSSFPDCTGILAAPVGCQKVD